jgi:hypothetical protein
MLKIVLNLNFVFEKSIINKPVGMTDKPVDRQCLKSTAIGNRFTGQYDW